MSIKKESTMPNPPNIISWICEPAPTTERFVVGDWVSHNGGVIDLDSKRKITAVMGYDKNGGVRYRIDDQEGRGHGLAYDCELDPWPEDETTLPKISPRSVTKVVQS